MDGLAFLSAESDGSVLTLFLGAGLVVQAVLIILILMSVFSWAIIYVKFRLMRSSLKKSSMFLDLYHSNEDMGALFSFSEEIGGPISELFKSGYSEVLKTDKMKAADSSKAQASRAETFRGADAADFVERALKRTINMEASKLEKSLVYLATVGVSAPFIGLFGTVWGIMNAFIGLAGSKGVPSLEVVAPGIAEALIATAIGLAAAIPATIAYNYFVNRVRALEIEMENFASGFLNTAERYLNR